MTVRNLIAIAALFFSLLGAIAAQETPDDKPQVTIFPHGDSHFWISGQINFILQGHGRFPALYSGPNSLKNTSEHALSRALTLYTGVEVRRGTELLFNVEDLSGHGISDALGLGGSLISIWFAIPIWVPSRTLRESCSIRRSRSRATNLNRSQPHFRSRGWFPRSAWKFESAN